MPQGGDWKEMLRSCGKDHNLENIQYHLDRDIDVNYQHPEYFTSPFFEAIREGNLDVVELLVAKGGASLVEREHATDSSPLEVALEERHHGIVDFILDKNKKKDDIGTIYTIFVSGKSCPKEVLLYLANMGHILVLEEQGNDDDDECLIQELKESSGNSKISIKKTTQQATYWIVVVGDDDDDDGDILSHMDQHALKEVNRIVLLALNISNPKVSQQVSWLLENNSKVTALVQPTSWWTTWFSDWRKALCDSTWWCMTTFDAVEGNCYNHQQRRIEHMKKKKNHEEEYPEHWKETFKSLMTTTSTQSNL